MKKRCNTLLRVALGGALTMSLLAGCGGSSHDYVYTSTGNAVTTSGTIEVEQVLARAVSQFVTHLKFVGLNDSGEILYGPESRVKSEKIVLSNVSLEITRLRIEYWAGRNLVGQAEVPVAFDSSGRARVVDPSWTDSPAGPVKFSDQPFRIPVPSRPLSVVSGDFNEDGHPDLASANTVGTTVSVALGLGDGTFGAATSMQSGVGPTGLAAGHLDGDRHLDIVVANFGADLQPGGSPPNNNIGGDGGTLIGGGNLAIFHGHGDGTFTFRHHIEAGNGPTSVVIGDFNRDGRSDLACTDFRDNTVTILLGDGLGRFEKLGSYPVGERPRDLAIGYINDDEHLDIAVANEGITGDDPNLDGSASVLLGVGDGSFHPATSLETGSNPHHAQLSDLNGDGKIDLVIANFISNDLSVFMGRGDGTFAPQVKYATPEVPLSVAVGDFNLDGRLDLAVACATDGVVAVLAGRGNGEFEPAVSVKAGDGTFYVVSDDFNHDGRPDFATANAAGSDLSVILGTP